MTGKSYLLKEVEVFYIAVAKRVFPGFGCAVKHRILLI
jgi:hypothetical protein